MGRTSTRGSLHTFATPTRVTWRSPPRRSAHSVPDGCFPRRRRPIVSTRSALLALLSPPTSDPSAREHHPPHEDLETAISRSGGRAHRGLLRDRLGRPLRRHQRHRRRRDRRRPRPRLRRLARRLRRRCRRPALRRAHRVLWQQRVLPPRADLPRALLRRRPVQHERERVRRRPMSRALCAGARPLRGRSLRRQRDVHRGPLHAGVLPRAVLGRELPRRAVLLALDGDVRAPRALRRPVPRRLRVQRRLRAAVAVRQRHLRRGRGLRRRHVRAKPLHGRPLQRRSGVHQRRVHGDLRVSDALQPRRERPMHLRPLRVHADVPRRRPLRRRRRLRRTLRRDVPRPASGV